MVQRMTCLLIEDHPLNIELDNKESYLAYREISTAAEEDEGLDLSLDCLKVRGK